MCAVWSEVDAGLLWESVTDGLTEVEVVSCRSARQALPSRVIRGRTKSSSPSTRCDDTLPSERAGLAVHACALLCGERSR